MSVYVTIDANKQLHTKEMHTSFTFIEWNVDAYTLILYNRARLKWDSCVPILAFYTTTSRSWDRYRETDFKGLSINEPLENRMYKF